MNDGYIKIPRSLLNDPIWKSLPYTYRHIYLTILQHMAFEACKQNDFGLLTELQPGQFLTTERKLVDLCDEEEIDKSLIHRALIKFRSLGFSNHKTNRKKTIITITRTDILELLKPRIEPNSNQTRTIKEESEDITFSLKKESEKEKRISLTSHSPSFKKAKFSQEDFQAIRIYCDEKELPISDSDICQWLRKYPPERITNNLSLMLQRNQPFEIKWLVKAIQKDYAGEPERILQNRNFAFEYKNKMGWSSLVITQQYCRCENTRESIKFNLNPETFELVLLKTYQTQSENFG